MPGQRKGRLDFSTGPELLNKPLPQNSEAIPPAPLPGRLSPPRLDFSTGPELLNRPLPAEDPADDQKTSRDRR
jgi:hypothetical protein